MTYVFSDSLIKIGKGKGEKAKVKSYKENIPTVYRIKNKSIDPTKKRKEKMDHRLEDWGLEKKLAENANPSIFLEKENKRRREYEICECWRQRTRISGGK